MPADNTNDKNRIMMAVDRPPCIATSNALALFAMAAFSQTNICNAGTKLRVQCQRHRNAHDIQMTMLLAILGSHQKA